jgi:RNA polymerase sigma factor (sigma-70 family)
VAQALAGSQTAFEQILRRYQRPVISLIARIVGDHVLAEDLAQETFVKAYATLAAFDPTRRLSSWLLRIAHNTALDALRRARTSLPHARALVDDSPMSLPPAGADPVEREALGRRSKRR